MSASLEFCGSADSLELPAVAEELAQSAPVRQVDWGLFLMRSRNATCSISDLICSKRSELGSRGLPGRGAASSLGR